MDWREYIPWARSRARRFTPTGILAYEDYAVIAELALWKAAQRHDGRCAEAFKGFAFGFIRNDILHAIRDSSQVSAYGWERGERFPQTDSLDLWAESGDDEKLNAHPYVEAPDVARDVVIRWALSRLPKAQEYAVWKVGVDGYTRAEIGETLGISATAAANTYTRGIDHLRRLLG